MAGKFADSFGVLQSAEFGARPCHLYSLQAFQRHSGCDVAPLPYCKRVLLENLLRHEDGEAVTQADIRALASGAGAGEQEIAFHPGRVLMPDSSGVPLLVDLASLRDRAAALGRRADLINPTVPVDIVVDHSVTAQFTGTKDSVLRNIALEFERNQERYRFLKWAQHAFQGLRVVPPGNGIVHQVNLESLAQVVSTEQRDGLRLAFPDSLVGMDSHTTMVNGMGVMGWGVGGIEAASAMLGEPISMLVPPVVGCRLTGVLPAGSNATDLVLALTQALRRHGVVGKFVEFTGAGLDTLSLADRATVANMAPEYGATMGFFAIDRQTIDYLRMTGRAAADIALVEQYARLQGLWRAEEEPVYDEVLQFDLGSVVPSLAGPSRPQDRRSLQEVPASFEAAFAGRTARGSTRDADCPPLENGDIVIAAITSCTNTSNPFLMIAAGLLARNAALRGLRAHRKVKTSLSPGSRQVAGYLEAAGLDRDLETLGFHVVGYGCMTCMGGAGDLLPGQEAAIASGGLATVAVLSGNRNFSARVHPAVRANYLASPPLVVAYAIAGTILRDLTTEPLGQDSHGRPVFLKDIWPADHQVQETMRKVMKPELFRSGHAHLFDGDPLWNKLDVKTGTTFAWDEGSTYIRPSPYGDTMGARLDRPAGFERARILAILGDDVTTDHISPVGSTSPDSAVGKYLLSRGVRPRDFNLLLTRRGNPDVVVRTAFSNVGLRNFMAGGREGGITAHMPGGELMDIHSAATRYASDGVPLVVIAGKNYGAGSSRDTAAKGTSLLGVRAVIAESFERIHRSNLVGMGVLPLQFPPGVDRQTLRLEGSELVDLVCPGELVPRMPVLCRFTRTNGSFEEVTATLRIDTLRELKWVKAGGVLAFVGNEILAQEAALGPA